MSIAINDRYRYRVQRIYPVRGAEYEGRNFHRPGGDPDDGGAKRRPVANTGSGERKLPRAPVAKLNKTTVAGARLPVVPIMGINAHHAGDSSERGSVQPSRAPSIVRWEEAPGAIPGRQHPIDSTKHTGKAAGARDRKAGAKWGGDVVSSLQGFRHPCPPHCSDARRPNLMPAAGDETSPVLFPAITPIHIAEAGGAHRALGDGGLGRNRDVWL